MSDPLKKQPLLVLEKIHKSFGGVHALNNARLEILPGEIHTLLGENGAGKSTLVKIIAGAHQRDSGSIIWEGCPIEITNLSDALNLGIRIIYQHLNVLGHLTVSENLSLGREKNTLGFIDKKFDDKQSKDILNKIGVDIDPNTLTHNLSIAERQLIEIGRALQGDIKLLVMDEPTSSLGDQEVERLFRIIRGLRDNGVAIIYISHKLDEIINLSDRITVLRDGQYIKTVDSKGTSEQELVEMMVGRKLGHKIVKEMHVKKEVVLEVNLLTSVSGLKDVSFNLHQGEILGVYGLMGSGRTELARALFGADPLSTGEIILKGEKVTIKSPSDAKKYGIGLVSEDKSEALFPLISVKENLSNASTDLYTNFSFINKSIERSLCQKMIDGLFIRTPTIDEPVARLSGGNQQKVIIGRWLMRESRILILDDPTCGIDVGVKQELYKLLNTMTALNTSFIMTSSELPELIAISDRILVLHNGRVAGILSGQEINQRNILNLAIRGTTTIKRVVNNQQIVKE